MRIIPVAAAVTGLTLLLAHPAVAARPAAKIPGNTSSADPTLTVGSAHIFAQATELSNTTVPATARNLPSSTKASLKLGSKTTWQTLVSKRNYTGVTIPLATARNLPAGRQTLTLTSGKLSATGRVHVHRGWAPLVKDENARLLLVSYPRCGELVWTYDNSKAPDGTTKMEEDLAVVFARYAELTGLTIRKAKDASEANLRVRWEPLASGADGVGGSAYSGSTFVYGEVVLNTQSEWAKTPGFGDSGRGALLYHETGHVLGLGHVNIPTTLMNPEITIGTTNLEPGPLEVKALTFLYAPKSCTNSAAQPATSDTSSVSELVLSP